MWLAFQISISSMDRQRSAEDAAASAPEASGGAVRAASDAGGLGGVGPGLQARPGSVAASRAATAANVFAAGALLLGVVLACAAVARTARAEAPEPETVVEPAVQAPDRETVEPAAQAPGAEAAEPAAQAPGAEVAEPAVQAPDREAVLERLRPAVGEPHRDLIVEGDTLLDVALRNRIGIEPLSRLNPDVDIWIPRPGTIVRLPSPIVLPDVEAEGLVINIPEMRLFDFRTGGEPEVFSAAIGDLEDPTPTGEYAIRDKREDPVWTVPESIRNEKPDLPEVVPAGPENPLGSRWMRIGGTSYGIHGTNMRWSIGRRATHGCVRLYESDMRTLYDRTPEGTPVQIVYQPWKWGRQGSDILLEAHPDIYARFPDRLAAAFTPMRDLGLLAFLDLERAWRTIVAAQGVPVVVGRLPDDLAP